jgi:hypothetical protein
MRKISRLHFGKLLFKRWTGSAMVQNLISGFQATGIVPLEKSVIPEHILTCPMTKHPKKMTKTKDICL